MGTKLYVGNLSYDASTESLRECFAEVGEVAEVNIITDRETGRSRGFAFVTMKTEADAQSALSKLNGAVVDGRPLRVNEAEERGRGGPPRGDNYNSRGGHRGW